MPDSSPKHVSEIAQLCQPCTPLQLTLTCLREGYKDNTHGGGITPAVEREGYTSTQVCDIATGKKSWEPCIPEMVVVLYIL